MLQSNHILLICRCLKNVFLCQTLVRSIVSQSELAIFIVDNDCGEIFISLKRTKQLNSALFQMYIGVTVFFFQFIW